jgi:hypothetical protein
MPGSQQQNFPHIFFLHFWSASKLYNEELHNLYFYNTLLEKSNEGGDPIGDMCRYEDTIKMALTEISVRVLTGFV